ncbi:MAG: ATP-binding protein [Leptospiraceae bacterium]|nr:ATP-binding protein [Leptospiraceae bacterium]
MNKNEKPRPEIGKSFIELVTEGMYEDCRDIYREYIQNSADAIDKAEKLNLYDSKEKPRIEIIIDKENRKIIIEDNGSGIKSNDTQEVLLHTAKSNKEIGVEKGFRGIGKLHGLAYCDYLLFETSYKGEKEKTIMHWDSKKLKSILSNASKKEEAWEVIDKVTDFDFEVEKAEEHYFKVILENVTNDFLLEVENIKEYLSMVAPVPLPVGFSLKNDIYQFIKDNKYPLDEYIINLNNEQLFKAYTTTMYTYNEKGDRLRLKDKNGKDYEIFDIRTFEMKLPNSELLGWGWYGISEFPMQIPEKGNPARGLRLRKHNIQIGTENTLVSLHREDRGNFYFFGEIHAVHKDLIPNGRRDNFKTENETYKFFTKWLKNFFHNELYKIYYEASKIRNIKQREKELYDYGKKLNEGRFQSKEEKKKIEESFENKKKKVEQDKKEKEKIETKVKDSKDETSKVVGQIYERIFNDTDKRDETEKHVESLPEPGKKKPKYRAFEKFPFLERRERKLITLIYETIDKVLQKNMAENLKDKIDEEIESKYHVGGLK